MLKDIYRPGITLPSRTTIETNLAFGRFVYSPKTYVHCLGQYSVFHFRGTTDFYQFLGIGSVGTLCQQNREIMEILIKRARKSIPIALVWVMVGLLPIALGAQNFKLDNGQGKVSVTGTSSLHDWEEIAEQKSGTMALGLNGESFSINALDFAVEAESLKSGKSGMDKNTYKALMTDKHKQIVYKYESTKSISSSGANSYKVVAVGKLTIAGKTNGIEMDLDLKVDGDKVLLKGSKALKMTDYGIEPPKALMGTIKTGDDIVVHFDTVWKK